MTQDTLFVLEINLDQKFAERHLVLTSIAQASSICIAMYSCVYTYCSMHCYVVKPYILLKTALKDFHTR